MSWYSRTNQKPKFILESATGLFVFLHFYWQPQAFGILPYENVHGCSQASKDSYGRKNCGKAAWMLFGHIGWGIQHIRFICLKTVQNSRYFPARGSKALIEERVAQQRNSWMLKWRRWKKWWQNSSALSILSIIPMAFFLWNRGLMIAGFPTI